jgi:hypothetical protein
MTRAVILALCTLSFASAQDVAGEWIGTTQSHDVWSRSAAISSRTSGDTQKLVLNLARDRQGAWACTIYSGRTGSGAIPCTSLAVKGARVNFVMMGGRFPMSFIGKLSADGKSITGVMQRGTEHLSLEFDRVGRPPAATPSPATNTVSAATAPATDSAAVLERGLTNLSGTHNRLVRYTCLETVERSHYAVPATRTGMNVMTEAPPSCSGRQFGSAGPLHLMFEDRLRLAVAVADGKEIDSWASAGGFDSRSISKLVSNGPISTGAFGTVLLAVFENPSAKYQFAGQRSTDGRTLYT